MQDHALAQYAEIDLAMRFNKRFGEIFVVPAKTADQVKFMGMENALRIRDLTNPEKKMSKSTAAENSKIMLDDEPAQAAKKIMGATTDSEGVIRFDMVKQPGVSNLLTIEAMVTNTPLQDVISTWAGETRYGELKKKVASSVSQMLELFQARLNEVTDEQVLALLDEGERYANEVANKKLFEAQKAFNLR